MSTPLVTVIAVPLVIILIVGLIMGSVLRSRAQERERSMRAEQARQQWVQSPKQLPSGPAVAAPQAAGTLLSEAPVRAGTAATIFISYSRQDEPVVNRLRVDLSQAGAVLWIDHDRLTPGTPNWEEAVRQGIARARAVVYVASPNARKSPYVHDEITIARNQQKTVYPFWAAGTDWHDCVPLGWGTTQYVDGRDSRYAEGLRELLAALGLPR
jgi:hypothetical protein